MIPNKTKLELAIELALFAHGGQKDAAGEPYILHPLRVMEAARQAGCSEEECIAAVLHDVVEDTEVELTTIRRLFGDESARLVEALTRRGTPNSAEEETYPDFIVRICEAGTVAVIIKHCDVEDNLGRIDNINETDPAKAARLAAKYHDALTTMDTWRRNGGHL